MSCRSSANVTCQVFCGLPVDLFPSSGIQFTATFAGPTSDCQPQCPRFHHFRQRLRSRSSRVSSSVVVKRSTVINQCKTRRVCRWNKVRSWRTRLELDFADDDPTSVEVETGDDALADRVMQRHRHVTRRLRRVVALRRELHRRK